MAPHFDKGGRRVMNFKTGPSSGLPGNSEHVHMMWTPQTLKESQAASFCLINWLTWLSNLFTESCKALDLSPKMIMVVETDSEKVNSYARTMTLWGWWLSQVCM